MANKAPADSSSPAIQGEAPAVSAAPQPGGQPEHQHSSTDNTVSKSGPLLISSKGLGWTSWKKRWFILGNNSLVFYRSDPNATGQKNPETNLPLGGIDLNNSGSVEAKPDKKLLNLLFPDGRDGRSFTLKAETSEDLHEWKNALEMAIAQAPSSAAVTGENGTLNGEQAEAAKGSSEQQKEKHPLKSTVIGRPILLALQDIDGSASFLEKALKFIEEHGIRTEGILRQAADVEEVEKRVYEYEHGKTDFSAEEDAHVIADCVKHILRELPSPPVPASCCNALLDAFKNDRSIRIRAMRTAILETFPEPNRNLLQRLLIMMQIVASHKAVNRMGTSAVAACMAPLILRPLLAGDCEVEGQHMDVGGDSSFQLLQAAAAANHAQAIIIILMDDYDQFFGEGLLSHDLFSEEEESGSEEGSEYEDDEMDDDDYDDEEEDDDEEEYGSEEVDEDEEDGSEELEEDEEDGSDEEEGETEDESEQPESKNQSEGSTNENEHSVGHKAKKKLSTEAIDVASGEESEIKRLEATKKHLEHQLAQEVKSNKALHTSLEGRKRYLDERRLALESDVVRLQEQLLNERDVRSALDAGLSIANIPISASIDEKVKAHLMEIAAEEASINGLQQRVDDIGVLLNQHREKNYTVMLDRGIHPPEAPPQDMIKQKGNEANVTPRTAEKSAKSKGGTESKHELSSVSKRFSSKPEGSSTSALSKLTTRLNFLKERRTQIANELQTLDKGRESGESTPETEKGKQPEGSLNTDKKQEVNEAEPQQKSESKSATESDSSPPTDASHKTPSHEDSDKGKGSEGHSTQHLDAVKSYESKPSRKRSTKTTR